MVNLIYSPSDFEHAVSRGNGILKAQDFADLECASSLVKAAKVRAQKMKATAKVDYQKEMERGYREGFELAEAEAFSRLLSEQVEFDKKLLDIKEYLADLVKSAVRTIITSFDEVALTEAIVTSGLYQLRRDRRVEIRLPCSSAVSDESFLRRLVDRFTEIECIEIIENSTLEPGHFVVESNTSRMEFDVGRKLDELEAMLDVALGRKTEACDTDERE